MRPVPSPFRPVDDAARTLARALLDGARTAALGVIDPESGGPMVTRIAVASSQGRVLALISDLAAHSRALASDPRASLLIAGPPAKGDPLTHPRLTLQCRARFEQDGRDSLRGTWLNAHPKAAIYVDFNDFRFVSFDILQGYLNGGFGKAYVMTRDDVFG